MADLNSDDFYKVLGVPKDADVDAIKKAYRKLAIKWHPDKNPDDPKAEDNFKKVAEAYGTLSDKEKRQEYDQFGKQGAGGMPGGAPGHFGGSRGMSQEEAAAMFAQMFGGDDPFAAFFGGGGGMGGPRGGRSRGGLGGSRAGVQFVQMGGGSPFMFGGGGSPFGGMGGGDPFGGGMHGGGMQGFGGGRPFPDQGQQQRQQQQQRMGEIPPGTRVLLKGLRSARHLNGEMGEVLGFDPASDRYIVHLEDDGEGKKFKRENIQQIVQGVEIFGLARSPELNGSMGTLFDRNLDSDRYNVRVERAHKTIALLPGNVILPVGTSVVVVGLTKGTHYNGRAGTVSQVDRGNQRYVVETENGEHVRVKWENVRV